MWNNKRVRARIFEEIDGEEVPTFKEGTTFVNSDKTAPGGLPYVLKYDDPLESDEAKSTPPHSPDDHIRELHTSQPRPDPETEYRKALRDTIRTESVLIIHSDETQPDREDLPTGEWTIGKSTRTVNKLMTHVVEVHDPRGKWVGDISPDRAAFLLDKFTVATRNPTLCGRLKPGTFQQELGLPLLRYQSGRKISGSERVKMRNHCTTPPPLIQEGLLRTYDIKFIIVSPPLN
jgi:hypothetical protein